MTMEGGSQKPISVGETWRLFLGDSHRNAKVVKLVKRGWWHCIDAETGIDFMASERWFQERVTAAD